MARTQRSTGDDSYTLTLAQYVGMFQAVGIPMDKVKLANGIRAGIYPGRVVNATPTRTTFEVWRRDVEAFFESKKPKGVSK